MANYDSKEEIKVPKKKKNKWYSYSECSRHMIVDPSKFIELTNFNDVSISFRRNEKGKIIGKGTVEIGNLTKEMYPC